MIPIQLEYREGTLPYKLQQEIDELYKSLKVTIIVIMANILDGRLK